MILLISEALLFIIMLILIYGQKLQPAAATVCSPIATLNLFVLLCFVSQGHLLGLDETDSKR